MVNMFDHVLCVMIMSYKLKSNIKDSLLRTELAGEYCPVWSWGLPGDLSCNNDNSSSILVWFLQ